MGTESSSSRVEVVGESKTVDIDSVSPNKFNYNKQNEKTFTRVLNSLKKFGFIDPVIVRRKAGGYEIINGEHRWRAAKMANMEQIPIMDVGVMEDSKAKQLCIILNELKGKPDEVRLAELLRDIHEEVSVDELLEVMPYSDNELDMYINAMDFSFDSLPSKSVKTEAEETEDMLKLKLGWEGDKAKLMMERLAMIADQPEVAVETAVEGYLEQERKRKQEAANKPKLYVPDDIVIHEN